MIARTKIYRVITTIDIEARDEVEAAHEARMSLCGPNAPMVYSVAEKRRVDGEFVEIDLSKEN